MRIFLLLLYFILHLIIPSFLFSINITFNKKINKVYQSSGKIKALSVSPNGRFLVFTSTIRDKKGDVYLYNIQEKKTKLLTTSDKVDSQPIFANDNKTIYYFSRKRKEGGIYKITIDNYRFPVLVSPSKYWCEFPSIDKNNQFLLYVSNRNNKYGIYKLNLTTKKETIIMNTTSMKRRPVYSSKNDSVFYTSNQAGGFSIFQYFFKSKKVKKLKSPGGFTFQPTIDDSSHFIIAVSNKYRNKDLFLIPLNKRLKMQRITILPSHDFFPALDTKNNILYFVSLRDGGMGIYSRKYMIVSNSQ